MTGAAIREVGAGLEEPDEPVVAFEHVSLAFDDKVILKDVSFTLNSGHTKIILGASGAGKSITLKIIMGLLKPDAGAVWVNGQRVDQLTEEAMMAVRADLGMVFQEGALFDSLRFVKTSGTGWTRKATSHWSRSIAASRKFWVSSGLSEYIDRMPSDLSGGQRRRVAIARAMTSKPKIVLYDEATTGLDPITATTVDDEIIKLRDLEEVSSIVVTHQLRDAFYVATRTAERTKDGKIRIGPAGREKERETEFLMLRDGLIAFEGDAEALRNSKDEYLRTFLS